ncbi:MAG: low-specificity L-threonine aldolase [Firmicutes bacterium]|nr:low-specificity L-threonine aldolase [Bacillota bacterium]
MIDLRSDTVTKPSAAMRRAMAEAQVGDDVYGEDPTVCKLEELAADLLGMEAALFVTSGTQGNQVAVLAHTSRGDEVIVEQDAHIYYYEVGAMASLAGVQVRTVPGRRGQMSIADIRAQLRGPNIHFPEVRLICLENTHNRAGGAILPLTYMQDVRALADEAGLAVHLDGARLWNAVVASGVSAKAYAACCDSVQFCLSKGLGAPIGSLLVGSRAFIGRARKWRKALGGGMRQAGVIAAPGILALTEMVERLAEDHRRARRLAEGLADIPGFRVDVAGVETNIVVADVAALHVEVESVIASFADHGVLVTGFGGTAIRFVTHVDIDDQAIATALSAALRVAADGVRSA